MTDLIERLRTRPTGDPHLHALVHEAADEIERRTKEAGLAWSEVEKRDAEIQRLTKERVALTEELRVERLNHGYLREEFDELHTGAVERLRQLQATIKERDALRRMLACRVAGPLLYTDDGELQDNSTQPFIDFKRDSVEEIERKLIERGIQTFAKEYSAAIDAAMSKDTK